MTQEANFEKIYFFLILHLILGKVTKFVVEKPSISEIISQKPHGGWGGKHPPVLSELTTKKRNFFHLHKATSSALRLGLFHR